MAKKWEINRAVRHSSLPAPSRLIMLVLSDLADVDDGVIPDSRTPSLRELAEWTGLDKSTVTRHLDALDESGWVCRTRPPVEVARRDHVKTTYRLDVPLGAESTMPEGPNGTGMVHSASSQTGHVGNGMVHSATPMVQSAPSHGAENTMGMVHSAPVPYTDDIEQIFTDEETGVSRTLFGDVEDSTKKPKRSKAPKPPESPESNSDFMAWYAAYPKVGNRPGAYAKWLAATKKISAVELLERTEAYAKAYAATGEHPKFIPLPATWLHQERWNDPLPRARASPNGHQPYRNPEDTSIYEEGF